VYEAFSYFFLYNQQIQFISKSHLVLQRGFWTQLKATQGTMGQIIGVSNVKEPPYASLMQSGSELEIRLYQPIFVAEVFSDGNSNKAFMSLAKYIGVFGTPENEVCE
jgi:hypothetical protein